MSISALTLDTTGQVKEWADAGGVTSPTPAGQTLHTDVTGISVVNDPANGLRYTKVMGGVFTAMDQSERDAVDNETPSWDTQVFLLEPETPDDVVTSATYQSVFASPLQPRPVKAGRWKLEASFCMRCDSPQVWTANGVDSGGGARLIVAGIELPWANPTELWVTYSGFITAEMAEGPVPAVDFQLVRPTGGGVQFARLELVLHNIGHVHAVEL